MRASVPLDNTNLTVLLNLFLSFFCFYLLSVCTLAANVWPLGEVANFGTDYFLSKIKFLARNKRVFTTKFAILPNACYGLVFFYFDSFFCNNNSSLNLENSLAFSRLFSHPMPFVYILINSS